MGSLMDFNESNFEADVTNAKGTVLVDFWAPWCGPCKMQTPILEKLAGDESVNAKIGKVNTDDNPGIAQKYNIVSIPTLILFKDGKEVDRMVGVQPETILKDKLK